MHHGRALRPSTPRSTNFHPVVGSDGDAEMVVSSEKVKGLVRAVPSFAASDLFGLRSHEEDDIGVDVR